MRMAAQANLRASDGKAHKQPHSWRFLRFGEPGAPGDSTYIGLNMFQHLEKAMNASIPKPFVQVRQSSSRFACDQLSLSPVS